MTVNPKLVAYLESVGAGAAVAGLQAAYQSVSQPGAAAHWQPVLAAFLVGAMGYLVAALRWLQTPPSPPSAPVVPAAPAPAIPPALMDAIVNRAIARAAPELAPKPPAAAVPTATPKE